MTRAGDPSARELGRWWYGRLEMDRPICRGLLSPGLSGQTRTPGPREHSFLNFKDKSDMQILR